MNDLEICKRIAEIEGECIEAIHGDVLFVSRTEDVFNPLQDKALCFDLMVKYDVVFLDGEASAGCISGCSPEGGGYYCNGIAESSDPQRAICLAIIDAHKEK